MGDDPDVFWLVMMLVCGAAVAILAGCIFTV